ncbi:MAG TPA: helix-turn-helix transcriptional regulator [Ramlibacter sp.]|jgi:transcriptional regulator with XRE-family HTH domain
MLSKNKASGEQGNPLRLDAGTWLKQLREEAGLSQRDLANMLSLDYYTFISQLENGRGKIPSNRYREWAVALKVDEKIFVKRMLMYYDPHSYEILFGEDAA